VWVTPLWLFTCQISQRVYPFGQDKIAFVAVHPVNEQPVRLYVAFPLARQSVAFAATERF